MHKTRKTSTSTSLDNVIGKTSETIEIGEIGRTLDMSEDSFKGNEGEVDQVDFLFIDHDKSRYLEDLVILEGFRSDDSLDGPGKGQGDEKNKNKNKNTRTCRKCHKLYEKASASCNSSGGSGSGDSRSNSSGDSLVLVDNRCRFHPDSYTTTTERERVVPDDTDDTLDTFSFSAEFAWQCCGNEDASAEGCKVGAHSAYDDDERFRPPLVGRCAKDDIDGGVVGAINVGFLNNDKGVVVRTDVEEKRIEVEEEEEEGVRVRELERSKSGIESVSVFKSTPAEPDQTKIKTERKTERQTERKTLGVELRRPGCVVVADNILSFGVPLSDYLEHVRVRVNARGGGGYVSSVLYTDRVEYADKIELKVQGGDHDHDHAGDGDEDKDEDDMVDGVEVSVLGAWGGGEASTGANITGKGK